MPPLGLSLEKAAIVALRSTGSKNIYFRFHSSLDAPTIYILHISQFFNSFFYCHLIQRLSHAKHTWVVLDIQVVSIILSTELFTLHLHDKTAQLPATISSVYYLSGIQHRTTKSNNE